MKSSLCGVGITAVCCFTPALVILFGAVGISAWLVWADYVLFPAMAGFMVLTIYAYHKSRQHAEVKE